MKQAIRRQPLEITTEPTKKANKIICNIMFGGVVAIALLMVISLLTYHPEDSAWSKTIATTQVHNWLGARGAYFSDILFTTIGKAAWLVPALLIAYGYRLICQAGYKNLDIETIMIRIVGVALVLLSVASLMNVYNPNDDLISHGGAVGQLTGTLLGHSIGWVQNLFPDSLISVTLSKIILFFLLFITSIMATGCGPVIWIETIGAIMIKAFQFVVGLFKSSDKADPNSDLANIEHLMTKEVAEPKLEKAHEKIEEESSEPKPNFFSKFIKSREKRTEETDADNFHAEPQFNETQQKKSNVSKTEPSFGFGANNFDKVEPDFTSSADSEERFTHSSTESTITPKFEPQVDENGQPKLPSIFKRPTITSPQQNSASSSEDTRFKGLSDWVDETQDEAPLVMPASMFAHASPTQAMATEETPVFNMFGQKSEPTISNGVTEEPSITTHTQMGQSMFSQTNSFADHRVSAPLSSTNPHENEQDFNAFLEELEKYHAPTFSEEPSFPTVNTISEDFPTVEIISEPVVEKDIDLPIDLPQVSEFVDDSYHQKFEPAFDHLVAPTVEPEVEAVAMPTWVPFEPEAEIAQPEFIQEEPPVIPAEPAYKPAMENLTPVEVPKQNIVMPAARMPEPMSEGKKAELLKHFPMAGQLPPLNLLGDPPPSHNQYDDSELYEMAQLIVDQLKNFSIKVTVANIEPGPVVTRFALELAPGVKVAQINNLEKDIARGLSVTSVRVVDIIPGTSYVGLEIPNKKREIVYFKSGLESQEYQDAKDPLTLILGKSISGEPVLANLAKMPHVLVAGTTGSGKSVGVNTMLLSMLFKARPEELRLILIDPKMLELSVYNDIPHLLIPVITDMKESANALRWCVAEMERRYMLMSQLKVRNIAGFNQKVQDAIDAGNPIIDPLWRRSEHVSDTENPPLLEKLPFIVVVIDEFADMMMLVGKKCEELIARLAQKARASGIHLILATQRPSVDVITGLIKANIPTRIAFQVSSKIDSRTIIDQQGAETLLGHGDILYAPSGVNVPIRVHGSFVDDHEVNKVAEFLKLTGEPDYIEDILQEPTEAIPGLSPEASGVPASPSDEQDPLFDEAVKIVVESRRASISYIQRKLRVGYQRAARLMEEMEELRIVTPPQSNGNREVLLANDNDDF